MFLQWYWISIVTGFIAHFTCINESFLTALFQSVAMSFAFVERESPPPYYCTLEWTKLLQLLCSNFPLIWINRQNAALNVINLTLATQDFDASLTHYTNFKNWTQPHADIFAVLLHIMSKVCGNWVDFQWNHFCIWHTFSFPPTWRDVEGWSDVDWLTFRPKHSWIFPFFSITIVFLTLHNQINN